MLKIPSKLSISLSIALSIIFFIVCIAGVVFTPFLVDILINIPDTTGIRDSITESGRLYILILTYAIMAIAILADILLFTLLRRVYKGDVFTPTSVALIRGVSWGCFLMCAAFFGLGFYFELSFIVAFSIIFLGLCLRVVKNVIEEATEIKSEHDYTI